MWKLRGLRKGAQKPHKGDEMSLSFLNETDPASARVTEILGSLGDKWTVLTLRSLGKGPFRFNALRREIAGISQKMLASTLRNLERNGMVLRVVTPTTPPQVEYSLTDLGRSIQQPICAFAQWAVQHSSEVEAARQRFDARAEAEIAAEVSKATLRRTPDMAAE